MPVNPTYPGVYIEEIPSGVRTIVGVATSITAFIGRALKGPVNDPVRIQSITDFDRSFGGLWVHSTMSYAVQHYFLHGGTDAIIVRVHNGATKATLSLTAGGETLILEASSEGAWGNNLQSTVDYETKDKDDLSPDTNLFNLTIEEVDPDTQEVLASEMFRNISVDSDSARFVTKVLEEESTLVDVQGTVPAARPDPVTTTSINDGGDGLDLGDDEISGSGLEADKDGLWALEKADLFNMLCIPPLTRTSDVGADTTLAAAVAYCKDRRALLIVDPPLSWSDTSNAESGVNTLRSSLGTAYSTNAAVYFPRLKMADPLKENRTEEFVPCGAAAGIFARTDAQRGVWKAPAGIDASLSGVRELSYKLTDGENGQLNPLGVNCLRTFPVYGNVVWGARTLAGADRLASEWKYVPVRRLALFIEESLYRGTQWVVFEPNDEPLWAQIRLNVGAFMQNLFRQGAFQGTSPRDAYFVKCDKETTTQNDINLGIVNILVGFAPLKPAEFVIIKIQQMAGQIET
ncbi:MAG: phage tail sheath family protein [Proteobacteria bacterium]|jgi:phage tail sheath protein FI|nr:phage tail sheath family protein [Pseudomonadota bacterium]MCK4605472.1 phage tail sheath family protein [Deltaproteobacteria bacterium]